MCSKSIKPTSILFGIYSIESKQKICQIFTVFSSNLRHQLEKGVRQTFDQDDRHQQIPAASRNTSLMTCIWCHSDVDSDRGQFMVQFMS